MTLHTVENGSTANQFSETVQVARAPIWYIIEDETKTISTIFKAICNKLHDCIEQCERNIEQVEKKACLKGL